MALCHSFWYFLVLTIMHTVQSYIHSSFTIRRGQSSCILIASSLSNGVPSRESKLGPALQQADTLITELRRTPLSYAAPHCAMPHFRERYTLFQNNHFLFSTINRYLSIQCKYCCLARLWVWAICNGHARLPHRRSWVWFSEQYPGVSFAEQ